MDAIGGDFNAAKVCFQDFQDGNLLVAVEPSGFALSALSLSLEKLAGHQRFVRRRTAV
jgi:hypothetical protein